MAKRKKGKRQHRPAAQGFTFDLPTRAVQTLAAVALEEGLEKVPPPELLAGLEPNGVHTVSGLRRRVENGRDFFRGPADLQMADGTTEMIDFDLPSRVVGQMLEASKPAPDPRVRHFRQAETGSIQIDRANPVPRWAGSYSFPKVWAEAVMVAERRSGVMGEHFDGSIQVQPSVINAIGLVGEMEKAHLVRVPPEQVAVLPDWEGPQNLWDFAMDAHLPFDPLYLDFEGPGGIAAEERLHDEGVERMKRSGAKLSASIAQLVKLGALQPEDELVQGIETALAQQPQELARIVLRGAIIKKEGALGALMVIPIGGFIMRDEEITGYSPFGRVVFGGDLPLHDRPGDLELELSGGSRGNRYSAIACGIPPEAIYGERYAGIITLPFNRTEALERGLSPENLVEWGRAVMRLADRSLAALSILDSDAVLVGDAEIETRDRKRAEKRGWPIAQQVFIRPTRTGGERSESSGEEAHYSHRFWVRGHTKHFPIGTRIADARPDLVKTCTRTGGASCGFCRRVWTEPFIKGPEDRPLVLKSLVKRKIAA